MQKPTPSAHTGQYLRVTAREKPPAELAASMGIPLPGLPYNWVNKCADFCDYIMPKVDEYERLLTHNPIFRRRTEGVGTISREEAIAWGLSGPMLRGSGVKWDLRKVDHYECYDDFEWDVAWAAEGDILARYRVRMQEMRKSIKISRYNKATPYIRQS